MLTTNLAFFAAFGYPYSPPNLPPKPVIIATILLILMVTTFSPADTTKPPPVMPSVMP
jgi:hypothetical protein